MVIPTGVPMKSLICLCISLTALSAYSAPRNCVRPEIEIKIDSSHEIARAIKIHESKQTGKKVKIKNLRLTQICDEDEKGVQEFELEYSYTDIDEFSCTAEVEIKNEKALKTRSLCEV